MKVEDKIYYHVNSYKKLNIGDVLVFDNNTHNQMYETVYNSSYKLNDMDANELLLTKKRNKNKDLSYEEFDLVLSTVNNDAYVMRELALESIRKEYYPEYPSRLNCLYLTDKLEDAINWVDILKRNKKNAVQILTLKVSGNIFEGDGSLMKRLNLSYNEHLENAKMYWSNATDNKDEILFTGTATVIDIKDIGKE
jgi:hypothetical protein